MKDAILDPIVANFLHKYLAAPWAKTEFRKGGRFGRCGTCFFCGGRGLLSNYVFIHIAPLYKGSPMVASFFLRGKFEDDLLFFPQDKQYHDDFFFGKAM